MSNILFSGIFVGLKAFLAGLNESTLDILFYCFVGFEILLVLYFIIKSHFAYEMRLIRSLDKINIYLLNNSYVNESNLIEFNKKMKKVPKVLRYHWQQYMLFRDQTPSFYMSANNVIDKPLRSSSLTSNLKIMRYFTILLVVVSAFLSTSTLMGDADVYLYASSIYKIMLIPVFIIVISSVYSMLQSLRQSSNLSDLYQTFHIYQRLIDKAATTIPEYVDFEVLFTKKEIKKGIPVLNEYLEKRARQEQEELERARLNAVEHEVYNFGDVDINGALILERSMKETEVYLSLRQRLLAEIQQTESEMDTLKKSYENTQKDYQRKLQASKENIERLRLQQESTTNRIENNYIRKQQTDEMKKQQQLEKDNDDATLRFNQEMATLSQEIDKRKLELEEHKKYIEKAMKSEYETYSTKIYKNLTKLVNEQQKEQNEELVTSKDKYAQEIVELKEQNEELTVQNDELMRKIKNFDKELGEKEEYYTNVLLETAEKAKSGLNKKKKGEQEEEVPAQPVVQEQPQYDEYGGYYDSEGYYRYQNGTYYDPNGNFYDEFGGHYDKEGNYYDANGQLADQTQQNAQEVVEETPVVEDVTVVEETPVEPAIEETPVVEEPIIEETPAVIEEAPAVIEEAPVVEEEPIILPQEETNEPEVEIPETTETPLFVEDEEEEVADNNEDEDKKVISISDLFVEDENAFTPISEEKPVELESQPDNEPKKSAGRPKKVVETVEEPPKKKAGRPRKVVEIVEETPKKKAGRPKKVVEAIEETPKKKAGRPKKVSEPVKKAGRPKKSEAAKETTKAKGPGRPPKPKGPGRPKKVAEPVKKPGRPKKSTATKTATKAKGPGRPPKPKGPGRPKKSETAKSTKKTTKSTVKAKGPGRPPKPKGPGRPPKPKGPGRPKKK